MDKEGNNNHLIRAGVPQGSVLEPYIYLIYNVDIPSTDETNIATFVDDIPILALDVNPVAATQKW